jgi:hypothetical protein
LVFLIPFYQLPASDFRAHLHFAAASRFPKLVHLQRKSGGG